MFFILLFSYFCWDCWLRPSQNQNLHKTETGLSQSIHITKTSPRWNAHDLVKALKKLRQLGSKTEEQLQKETWCQ